MKNSTLKSINQSKIQLILIFVLSSISMIYLYIGMDFIGTGVGVGIEICPVKAPDIDFKDLIFANRRRLHKFISDSGSELASKSILLPSSEVVLRDESDMELPGWRQTSNLYYVLGKFALPDVFVLIKIADELSYHLILPNYKP